MRCYLQMLHKLPVMRTLHIDASGILRLPSSYYMLYKVPRQLPRISGFRMILHNELYAWISWGPGFPLHAGAVGCQGK